MEGDPKFAASQDVPDFDYSRYAQLIGFEGIRVESPEALGAAWDTALSCGRPALLEVHTDPDVPPLPPHITFKQAKAYASALLKGDPNFTGIVKASIKQVFA